MVVVDGLIWGDTNYSDGYENTYDIVNMGSANGPVPSPWVATGAPWNISSSRLVSTGVGRVTTKISATPVYDTYTYLYAIQSAGVGSTEPFFVIYDQTDAGGGGYHCYLTPTTFNFGTFSVPLVDDSNGESFTITDETGFYFGYYTSYSLMYVTYDLTGVTITYYPKGGYNYETAVWTIRQASFSFASLAHAHPGAVPPALISPSHIGVTAQRSGVQLGPLQVFATTIGRTKQVARFDA